MELGTRAPFLQARKQVLCEKALAVFLAEIDAIESAFRRHSKMVMEVLMHRFSQDAAMICVSSTQILIPRTA